MRHFFINLRRVCGFIVGAGHTMKFYFILNSVLIGLKGKTGLTIQNLILTLDCQS